MKRIGKAAVAAAAMVSIGASVALADGHLEAAPGMPDGVKAYVVEAAFEDISFGLENAIVNRGLVIDYTSHIGEMLERTGADVGAAKSLYSNAQTMLFCSAVLSRKAMEADPANIAYCPYAVFAYEQADMPGKIVFGYRELPERGSEGSKAALGEVNSLLADIIAEAADQ